MRIASASKATAQGPAVAPRIAAVAPAAPPSGDAFEPPRPRAQGLRGALQAVRPFARGAVEGAVHPFHVVQREKLKAGLGLAGLAAASAGWHLMGLPDPTMGIVAGGGLVVGYDAWQVGRDLPGMPAGDARKQTAGAVASKLGLWALTSALAHFISPGEAHVVAQHAADAPDLARAAALGAASGLAAGADAVLFGLDAADHKRRADARAADDVVVMKPHRLRLLRGGARAP